MVRSALARPLAGVIAAVALAACGDAPGAPAEEPDGTASPAPGDGDASGDTGDQDGGGGEPEPEEPGIPQPPWPEPGTAVQTAGAVDVLDDGAVTQLCLGGMLESYPPQCAGLTVEEFDWAQHEGEYQNADGVRWGSFELAGSYDAGTQTLTVERSATATPDGAADPPLPQPDRQVSTEELPADWPGLLGSVGSGEHYPAFVEVIYDDGTLAEWLEAEFGEGNVQLHVTLTAAG